MGSGGVGLRVRAAPFQMAVAVTLSWGSMTDAEQEAHSTGRVWVTLRYKQKRVLRKLFFGLTDTKWPRGAITGVCQGKNRHRDLLPSVFPGTAGSEFPVP